MNKPTPLEEDFVYLPDSARSFVVRPSDICSLESEGNYTRVTLKDNTKILVRRALTKLEAKLKEHKEFFRTDRSTIVNLAFVKEVQFHDSKRLLFTLSNGHQVVLSRQQSMAMKSKSL
jgi:two-component system, LytTR family, response regulator